jgi:adenosylmethionine-8-amino-7-oxononanoate aminotransferase
LKRVRALCDRYGLLLILDEVITGFGRTGRMFAAEHVPVVPDVMTVSKGLSSGYMPIGAAIVSERVAQAFMGRPDGVLSHGQTYGGHPVACAVALANIELIEREGLTARAAELGAYLQAGLRGLDHHPAYSAVRGLGLVCGLEFNIGQSANAQAAGYRLRNLCRELGLITLTLHPGNVLFFSPPPIITPAEMDRLVSIVDEALSRWERECGLA